MAHRFGGRSRRLVACSAGSVLAVALLAGCPSSAAEPESTTDTDRVRAAALQADPVLAGTPVIVGDRVHGLIGWRRTSASRAVVVPLSDPTDDAGRIRHVHQAVRALLAQARAGGWQVFFVGCRVTGQDAAAPAASWSVHGYRSRSGYLSDLRVTARADVRGVNQDGSITVQLLAPYHLDPPSLLGDPPPAPLPAGGTCLDRPDPPRADQAAGTDHEVSTSYHE